MSVQIVKPEAGSVTIDFALAAKLARLVGDVNTGNVEAEFNQDLNEFANAMSDALGFPRGQSNRASEWETEHAHGQIWITRKESNPISINNVWA